jgi:hypothetical protein
MLQTKLERVMSPINNSLYREYGPLNAILTTPNNLLAIFIGNLALSTSNQPSRSMTHTPAGVVKIRLSRVVNFRLSFRVLLPPVNYGPGARWKLDPPGRCRP